MAKTDSKQMLERKISLLMVARTYIEYRTSDGICLALNRACTNRYSNEYWMDYALARDSLKGYIHQALRGRIYYQYWVAKQLGDDVWYDPDRVKKARQGRLAWIDWMIKCLEEDLEELKKPSTYVFHDNQFAIAA